MPTIKYWQSFKENMVCGKYDIPKQCRIGDTCFTSLVAIAVSYDLMFSSNDGV